MSANLPPIAIPGGAQGGYIPMPVGIGGNGQATIIVSYSRDPKRFAVNELATITPVNHMVGYYQRVDPASQVTVYSDPNEAVWPDGAARPSMWGQQNKNALSLLPYRCIRREKGIPIGYQEKDQSYVNLQTLATESLASIMMTHRAVGFYGKALNSANYLTTNTFDCTAGVGGKWSSATGTNPYIYNSLNKAALAINQQTAGAIRLTDLTLVLSPNAAYQTAATQEIRDYIAHSPAALAQIKGDTPGQNANWQLPDRLYGIKVVVDQTIQNTAPRLQALSPSYVAGDTTALLLCRPGDVPTEAMQIQSAFSTWHFFLYSKEEMMVEVLDDYYNKRYYVGMTDTWDVEMVSPETAALVTSIF